MLTFFHCRLFRDIVGSKIKISAQNRQNDQFYLKIIQTKLIIIPLLEQVVDKYIRGNTRTNNQQI